jgi:hypothetical protein
MLSAGLVSAIEVTPWFQTSWAPYLLLDADLRIRRVSGAYELAVGLDAAADRLWRQFPDLPREAVSAY